MAAETALRGLPGDDGLALEITSGFEHFRGGEIALTVDGGGAVDVRHRRAGEERHYSGSADRATLDALVARAADVGLESDAPRRTVLQPDEGTVTLELRRGDEVLARRAIPEGDRHEDEHLDGLLHAYEELVADTTDGALPFGSAAAPR